MAQPVAVPLPTHALHQGRPYVDAAGMHWQQPPTQQPPQASHRGHPQHQPAALAHPVAPTSARPAAVGDVQSVQSSAASKLLKGGPAAHAPPAYVDGVVLPNAALPTAVSMGPCSLPVPTSQSAPLARQLPQGSNVPLFVQQPHTQLAAEPRSADGHLPAAGSRGSSGSLAAPAAKASAAMGKCKQPMVGAMQAVGSLASFETPGGAEGQAWKMSAVKRQSDLDDSTVASSETGHSTSSGSMRIPSILRQIGASALPMIHGCFGLPLDENCRVTQPALLAADSTQHLMARLSALCTPPTVRMFCNEAHLALDKNWRNPELLTPLLSAEDWRGGNFVPGSFVHPNLAHNELMASDAAIEMVSRIIMHRASRLHNAWSAEDAARAETAALLGTAAPVPDDNRSLAAAVHTMLCRVVAAMQSGLRSWPTDLQRFSPCHLLLQKGKPRDTDAQFVSLAIEVPVRLHWASSTLNAPLPPPGQMGAIPFPCLQAVTFGMSRLNKGGPEVPTPLPTFLEIFDETDHSVPEYTTSSLEPMLNIIAARFAAVFGDEPLSMTLNSAPPVVPLSMQHAMQASIACGNAPPVNDGGSPASRSTSGETSPGGTCSTIGPSISQVGVTYTNDGNLSREQSSKDPCASQTASEHCSRRPHDHGAASDEIHHDSASAVSAVKTLLSKSGVKYLKFPAPGTTVTLTQELRKRAEPTWLRASALLPAERICTHIPHLLPKSKSGYGHVVGGVKRQREDGMKQAEEDLDGACPTAYCELELSCIPANYLFGRIVLSLALMDAVQVLA